MRQTDAELDRSAQDQDRDRLISGSIYCENCGYNLKTLPYVYNCPECGNGYNARPLMLKGIFKPFEVTFPLWEIVAAVFCVPVSVVLLAWGLRISEPVVIILGVTFALLSILLWFRIWDGVCAFIKARAIARRIRLEQES